jgi:hypothetical protein
VQYLLLCAKHLFVEATAAKLLRRGPNRISDCARPPPEFWGLSVFRNRLHPPKVLPKAPLARQSTVWRLGANVWRRVTSPKERPKRQTVEFHLQQGFVAMLDRHITRRIILGPIAGIGALLLSGGAPALAFDGPSFDCSQGVNSALAMILCRVPEAAQADWDLASAYWAFSSDDRDQRAFSQSMNQRCALPRQETAEESAGRAFAQGWGRTMWGQQLPIPGPQPISQNHVRCVITTFHNRAATLRSKLTGDALVESKLSPEEHIEIQAALIQKGISSKSFSRLWSECRRTVRPKHSISNQGLSTQHRRARNRLFVF